MKNESNNGGFNILVDVSVCKFCGRTLLKNEQSLINIIFKFLNSYC